MSEEEERDLGDVDDEIRQLYGEMMEINFKIIKRSRRQAERLEAILELLTDQIRRVSELRDLHIESARALSDTVGDILTAEWDLDHEDSADTVDDADEEDEDNDEDR